MALLFKIAYYVSLLLIFVQLRTTPIDPHSCPFLTVMPLCTENSKTKIMNRRTSQTSFPFRPLRIQRTTLDHFFLELYSHSSLLTRALLPNIICTTASLFFFYSSFIWLCRGKLIKIDLVGIHNSTNKFFPRFIWYTHLPSPRIALKCSSFQHRYETKLESCNF